MSKERPKTQNDRAARLGAALRANLARRKAQARDRATGEAGETDKPQDGDLPRNPAGSED